MTLQVFILILLGLIVALFIDHYRIHGYFYDAKDFTNALFNLFKSHEGLIVIISILIVGALLTGVYVN